LENDGFTRISANIAQGIYGYAINLDDFGIPLGGSVTNMSFGAFGNEVVDPVYIAGLSAKNGAVSSASSLSMILLSIVLLLSFRRSTSLGLPSSLVRA